MRFKKLRAQGLSVTDLNGIIGENAVARSIAAIRTGADVILQPALRNGRWFGRPDVLRRNREHSALGAWSYEVVDTKLAKETRGGNRADVFRSGGPGWQDASNLNSDGKMARLNPQLSVEKALRTSRVGSGMATVHHSTEIDVVFGA
jgi:hypothetical protein